MRFLYFLDEQVRETLSSYLGIGLAKQILVCV